MSYQSSQHTYSSSSNDYEHSYGYEDQDIEVQVLPTKANFKRKTITHNTELISVNEQEEDAWDANVYAQEVSPRSGGVIVNFSEKSSLLGMSYPGPEDGSLHSLKYIINEAKRAEGHLFPSKSLNVNGIFYILGGEYNEDGEMNIEVYEAAPEIKGEYPEEKGRFNRVPTRIRKTSNQALEIGIFLKVVLYANTITDFTDEATERDGQYYPTNDSKSPTNLTNEGLNHSKSSYLSGPVRYSKMPEEEAATVFEQRFKTSF